MSKEREQIGRGRGPLDTPAQRESDSCNNAGWDLHCAGQYEEAIEQFEAAVRINPRHALAVNNKGLSLRRLQKTDEALSAFREAISIASDFVKPYSNMGETLGMMGRRSEAAEWYRKALGIEPNYPRALQGLRQYCSRELSESDQQRMERLAQDHPQATPAALQGAQLLAIAHFEEALEKFDEAIRLAPSIPEFLDMKAECLNNMGKPDEALTLARQASELDPDFASPWVSRAWANLSKEDFAEAIRCAERAISLDQNHDMAWHNAGAALMMLGRFEEAIDKLDRGLSLNPDNFIAAENRAACRRQIEGHDLFLFGADLELARAALKAGQTVAVTFDFDLPNIEWDHVIALSQESERLVCVDSVDRPVDQILALASRLVKRGGQRLALDLTIRAKKKQRGDI